MRNRGFVRKIYIYFYSLDLIRQFIVLHCLKITNIISTDSNCITNKIVNNVRQI